jgi:hypothetical protein
MGKKAREIRTAIKGFARKLGYKETELGELKPIITKAEARRRFLQWKWNLSFLVIPSVRELYEQFKDIAEQDIAASLAGCMKEEIDAQILGELDALAV